MCRPLRRARAIIYYNLCPLFALADGRSAAFALRLRERLHKHNTVTTTQTYQYNTSFLSYYIPICNAVSFLFSGTQFTSLLQMSISVAGDDEQADRGDNDGRRHAEAEVAPEGEVVPEELRTPRLLTHDQVRGRAQQSQVAGHRADPG